MALLVIGGAATMAKRLQKVTNVLKKRSRRFSIVDLLIGAYVSRKTKL